MTWMFFAGIFKEPHGHGRVKALEWRPLSRSVRLFQDSSPQAIPVYATAERISFRSGAVILSTAVAIGIATSQSTTLRVAMLISSFVKHPISVDHSIPRLRLAGIGEA